MSHSQFHSTNLFILRHAWLNLWDKHMTTGRINQVTTFRSAFAAIIYLCVTSTHFPWCGVRHLFMCWEIHRSSRVLSSRWERVQATLNPQMASPRFPSSHVSSKIPLSHEKDKGHPPLMGTTNNQWHLKGTHRRGGSPSGYLHQVWPSASNPPPFNIAQTHHTRIAWGFKGKSRQQRPPTTKAGPLLS